MFNNVLLFNSRIQAQQLAVQTIQLSKIINMYAFHYSLSGIVKLTVVPLRTMLSAHILPPLFTMVLPDAIII